MTQRSEIYRSVNLDHLVPPDIPTQKIIAKKREEILTLFYVIRQEAALQPQDHADPLLCRILL